MKFTKIFLLSTALVLTGMTQLSAAAVDTDNDIGSKFITACREEKLDAAKLLEKKVDQQHIGDALHWSIEDAKPESVKFLLSIKRLGLDKIEEMRKFALTSKKFKAMHNHNNALDSVYSEIVRLLANEQQIDLAAAAHTSAASAAAPANSTQQKPNLEQAMFSSVERDLTYVQGWWNSFNARKLINKGKFIEDSQNDHITSLKGCLKRVNYTMQPSAIKDTIVANLQSLLGKITESYSKVMSVGRTDFYVQDDFDSFKRQILPLVVAAQKAVIDAKAALGK